MPKKGSNKPAKQKKHAAQKKTSLRPPSGEGTEQIDTRPQFVCQQQGPLILFRFTASEAQHQALARMESFYESSKDSSTYINLQEAATKRLCRNYQAFNMPISTICKWLQAMQISECIQQEISDDVAQDWWRSFTNPREAALLDHLSEVGCFKTLEGGEAPSYLISVTENSAIRHEVLHALYFLHSGYRAIVQQAWEGLSKKCRSLISQDLTFRGYGEHVWADEFQAFTCENGGEFGNKTKEECTEVKVILNGAQSSAWKELNLDIRAFS